VAVKRALELVIESKQGCNGGGVDISGGTPSTESYRFMDKNKPTSGKMLQHSDSDEEQVEVHTAVNAEEHEADRAEAPTTAPAAKHDRGLLLIGLFKLGKAVFFFCVGLGAIHLLHKDLGEQVLRLAAAFHRDAESHLVSMLMEKVDLIDAHRLRTIGFATFAYSALALTEGIGLMLEKVWAEYLTLFLTMSFLPWELYELVRQTNWFRFGLLVINLAVLAYLIWLLQQKKKRAEQAA
jgi:uncharacterized membrane protein (DUF2068 family)